MSRSGGPGDAALIDARYGSVLPASYIVALKSVVARTLLLSLRVRGTA